MGARYYNATEGRFISPDPFGHAASMDLYSFANGDPVNFVDPTGRQSMFGIPIIIIDPLQASTNTKEFTDSAIVEPATAIKEFATGDGPGELRVQAGLFLAVDAQFTRDETGAIRFMGGGGLGLGFATNYDATPPLNSPNAELGFDASLSGSLLSNLSGSLMYDQRFQFEDGLMPETGTIDLSLRGTPSIGGFSVGELYLQGGTILEENNTELYGDAGFNPQMGTSHGLGAFATIRVGGNDVPLGSAPNSSNVGQVSNAEQVQDPVGKFPLKR